MTKDRALAKSRAWIGFANRLLERQRNHNRVDREIRSLNKLAHIMNVRRSRSTTATSGDQRHSRPQFVNGACIISEPKTQIKWQHRPRRVKLKSSHESGGSVQPTPTAAAPVIRKPKPALVTSQSSSKQLISQMQAHISPRRLALKAWAARHGVSMNPATRGATAGDTVILDDSTYRSSSMVDDVMTIFSHVSSRA